MDRRQEFKVAFLRRAAQLGIEPGELEGMLTRQLEKEAGFTDLLTDPIKKLLGAGIDLGSSAIKGTASMAAPLMIAAPVGIGLAAGHGLAKTQGAFNADDTYEEKQRELVDAYRRAAKKLQLSRRVKRHRDEERSKPSFGLL